MCGIIGAFNTEKKLNLSSSDFSDAMNTMSYRGPDAQAQWVSPKGNVHFAHLRLSIIDPSEFGNQPMLLDTANGLFSMVFNGEVYNYLEIRSELIKLGYNFTTNTDSEVVLTAYAAWGDSFLSKLNGMFSIAIYNSQKDELFLARDRLGIKPLYYSLTSDGIVFSSEIKALHKLQHENQEIDVSLIHQYMDYGYSSGEETLDKNIKRLLPGHSLKVCKSGVEFDKYWEVNFSNQSNKSLREYKEEFLEIFGNSLKMQLRADVPVGVFLSGGLDSSAVVAMISRIFPEMKIKTFSVRYDFGDYGEEYDESKYAEMVSKEFGTEHHTYTMTADDFKKYIPEYVRTMDEPVTEAAAISLHYLSEMTREHAIVVLSGEGSDEIFGGYELYKNMLTIERIRKAITPAGAKIFSSLANAFLPNGNKIKKYINMTAKPFEDRYRGISVYDQSYKDKLYRPEFKNAEKEEFFANEIMSKNKNNSTLSRMLEFDTKTWLVDDLLIKADRMSMHSSIELRVPFLDHLLVEFASKIPDRMKINNGNVKHILKEAVHNILPDEIINREKRGFPTPLAVMFKGPLREYVSEKICKTDALINNLFHHNVIKEIVEEHNSNKVDHHRLLWQLVVLEEWMQQNLSSELF